MVLRTFRRLLSSGGLFAALLFFFACTTTPEWEKWDSPIATALSYRSESVTTGLELSFRSADFGLHGYISVASGFISPLEGDPHQAEYWYTPEGGEPSYGVGRLFAGGQRILIDEADAERMMALLEGGNSFYLQLRTHADHISVQKFAKCLDQKLKARVISAAHL